MPFWSGAKLDNFLFHGFDITSTAGMASVSVGLFSLAVLSEGLRSLRSQSKQYPPRHVYGPGGQAGADDLSFDGDDDETSSLLGGDGASGRDRSQRRRRARDARVVYTDPVDHVFQTLMYFLQLLLGYALMLSVMTFSLWMFLCIVLGSVAGSWFFRAFPMAMVAAEQTPAVASRPASYGTIRSPEGEVIHDDDDDDARRRRADEAHAALSAATAAEFKASQERAFEQRLQSQEHLVQVDVHHQSLQESNVVDA